MIWRGFASVWVLLFLSACATDPVMVKPIDLQVEIVKPTIYPIESRVITSTELVEPKDIWERVRNGFDIADLENELTDKHVRQLQANSEYVNRVLERSSSYLFYIIEEVEARDLPSELALLPFVESAFNPQAVSPAKAAGMWQFMPATGKSYNLKQNMFQDQRGDIVKSTRAALEYLQRLNDLFGDWQLALAAYNWGEGSVGRAIQKNKRANQGTDYFSLSMPNETKNYVPKLLAYKRIIENPEKYGFKLPQVPNHPYFVAVPVVQDIDLNKAIELSEMTKEQFISLNPSFNKPVILKEFDQAILLPFGKAAIFTSNLMNHQKPVVSWTAVKVNKTDTVEKIASLHQVNPSEIREVNNIPKGMKVRSGSSVMIPKRAEYLGDVEREIAQNGSLLLEREYTPVPVVMRCRGSKCTAEPHNLPNYSTKSKNGVATAKNGKTARADQRANRPSNGVNNSARKTPSPPPKSTKAGTTKAGTTKAGTNNTGKTSPKNKDLKTSNNSKPSN